MATIQSLLKRRLVEEFEEPTKNTQLRSLKKTNIHADTYDTKNYVLDSALDNTQLSLPHSQELFEKIERIEEELTEHIVFPNSGGVVFYTIYFSFSDDVTSSTIPYSSENYSIVVSAEVHQTETPTIDIFEQMIWKHIERQYQVLSGRFEGLSSIQFDQETSTVSHIMIEMLDQGSESKSIKLKAGVPITFDRSTFLKTVYKYVDKQEQKIDYSNEYMIVPDYLSESEFSYVCYIPFTEKQLDNMFN